MEIDGVKPFSENKVITKGMKAKFYIANLEDWDKTYYAKKFGIEKEKLPNANSHWGIPGLSKRKIEEALEYKGEKHD